MKHPDKPPFQEAYDSARMFAFTVIGFCVLIAAAIIWKVAG